MHKSGEGEQVIDLDLDYLLNKDIFCIETISYFENLKLRAENSSNYGYHSII